jgi:hypothetical protein
MRGIRLAAVLAVLILIPGQKEVSEATPRPHERSQVVVPPATGFISTTPESPTSQAMPIPGGGRILFTTDHGVGVLEPDGSESHFGGWAAVDAFWDPVHPGRVLVSPYTGKGPPGIRSFRRTPGGWRGDRRWPAGAWTQISPDGRWFAYGVLDKGRSTGAIRVAGRHGPVGSISGRFWPLSWTSDRRVVLGRWDGSGPYLWDPFAHSLTFLDLDGDLASRLPPKARRVSLDVSRMSWSSDGRFFAAPAFWRLHHRFRSGAVVGSLAEGIQKVIPTGGVWWATPTWSPARPEIAFVSSLRLQGRAALRLYDATTGRQRTLLRDAPEPRWVAWSPAGDWMLLDDTGRTRWLFVSRDGRRTIDYPWLGSYPRWASPGLSLHIVVC